jgi:Ca2+-binding EF-hand superfamily protein
MWNEKIFRVRFEDDSELETLRQRLGYVIFFPFIQPERAQFTLDLSMHDQRLASNLLVVLMSKEGYQNASCTLTHPDGTEEELPAGILRKWEHLDNIPKAGVFTANYSCAPEDRSFAARKQLFQSVGGWKMNVQEHEVLWWSGVNHAPPDVVKLMEFFVINFHNAMEPFHMILNQDSGNGGEDDGVPAISFQAFQVGLERLSCKKFAGPDEAQRQRDIFRYLDSHGEGELSEGEWGVLEQMFKEMMLDLEEFVKFLARAFNHAPDFLDRAWGAIDEDGSGNLTKDEWRHIVKRKLRYFGPCGKIYAFLDMDDEGGVSEEEFSLLKRIAENISLDHSKTTTSERRRSLKDMMEVSSKKQHKTPLAPSSPHPP